MDRRPVPRYYGLRIYMISVVLYGFLVIPFLLFLAFQRIPDIAENRSLFNSAGATADSLAAETQTDGPPGEYSPESDSAATEPLFPIPQNAGTDLPAGPEPTIRSEDLAEREIDSLLEIWNRSGQIDEEALDSILDARIADRGAILQEEEDGSSISGVEGEAFGTYFKLQFLLLLGALLAGFIYNRPFKRYFRKKRKAGEIPARLHAWCKKQLPYTPLVNGLILILPNMAVILYSLIVIIGQDKIQGETQKEFFLQFFYLTLLATLLEFLFVYYWQKHRVHIKYVDHLFTPVELRSKVFRNRAGGIRNRLLTASGMTTFLPLLIVMVYLVLSLTPLRELQLGSISSREMDILIGPWINMINPDRETTTLSQYEKLYYVNALDSIIMLVGIATGILVSFLYLVLFIKWTSQDITIPVRELLVNIRNTRGGGRERYTIVRTDDEIGELAEGYNEMTGKLHRYLEEISTMNRELEDKVRERTNEVVMQKEEIESQKEEIESQKEEIESQLEMTTRQKDTILSQNELILDSIRYAERIQSAMLPPEEFLSEQVTDHFILFRPRDIVSGDYYWTAFRDDKLLLAVADCTGHGVPGAFLSMLGIASKNEIVNRSGAISPGLILGQFRDIVIESLHQTGTRGEAQDGIEIGLCLIDPEKMVMEFAGANRPLYLIRNEEEMPDRDLSGKGGGQSGFRCIQYRGDHMPIGIYEQEAVPFTTHEIPLRKGDTLYLFSDGYVDQLGGPHRKTFRSKYFRELLTGIQSHTMEEQRRILLSTHEEWKGEVEQIDDILVVGIRI